MNLVFYEIALNKKIVQEKEENPVFIRFYCLQAHKKVAFFKSRLISSKSEQFKKHSNSSDWLKKSGSPKRHFVFVHVNRL